MDATSVSDTPLWPTIRDEYVISQFIAIVAESGSPELWDQLDALIIHLCDVRKALTQESAERCKSAGFEYLASLKSSG